MRALTSTNCEELTPYFSKNFASSISTVSAEEQRLVHQYLSEQNALLSENADTLPKTPEEILSVLDLTVTAPVSSFAPFSTNSTSDLGEDETFDIFEEDASFAIQPFETEGFINE